jgi:Dullard-like phosphatase family protein
MKDIKFNYALESPLIYDNLPNVEIEKISLSNKKLLLLDLDETLIHSDFSEQFLDNENIKYDGIISFLLDNSITDDESKDDSDEKKLNSVGIFIRTGVQKFLDEVSKYFEVGIFTASIPEYADAAINYLDPENKYIKLRLYRNNCINVGNLFKVKDLRILKNINIKNIVLVDNNMYSFIPQLNNGILINSFYYDKEDKELDNVLRYLIDYVFPADDVRKINGEFFGFKTILDDISKNLI